MHLILFVRLFCEVRLGAGEETQDKEAGKIGTQELVKSMARG